MGFRIVIKVWIVGYFLESWLRHLRHLGLLLGYLSYSEALTGSLCGAYPAIVHVFVLYFNYELCPLVAVTLVRTVKFMLLHLRLNELWPPSVLSIVYLCSWHCTWLLDRTYHGFTGVADPIG